jgi:hypothetical protein
MGESKRYRDCMAEINAVLQRYDMAGAVTVVDKNQHEALMAAANALGRMHKANDILMAALITTDPTFLPSKSVIWPDVVAGHEAIVAVRAAGIKMRV